MSKIFIPDKIKVGYQARKDTYTGRLAYVVYYDEKNALRKQASWDSWRDKKIEPQEFENSPTSGFVLNKKAGGYSSGWNHRQTYSRVYDPRNFEFEITIPNLLYVLENTNSIKGKGLEGEFVYGWDGSDLLLIPVSSPDYIEIMQFSNAKRNKDKITSKSLVLGGTYLANDNTELIYLGKFDHYNWDGKNDGKSYFFATQNGGFITIKGLTKIIKIISSEPVENYADWMDKLEKQTCYSPVDEDHIEYIPYTWERFLNTSGNKTYDWGLSCLVDGKYMDGIKIHSEDTLNISLKDAKKVRVILDNYDSSYRYISRTRHEEIMLPDFNSLKEFFDIMCPSKKQKFLKNGNPYE